MARRKGELGRLRDAWELAAARRGVGSQRVVANPRRTFWAHQAVMMKSREANHGVALGSTAIDSGRRSGRSRLHVHAGTSGVDVSTIPHHGFVHELLAVGACHLGGVVWQAWLRVVMRSRRETHGPVSGTSTTAVPLREARTPGSMDMTMAVAVGGGSCRGIWRAGQGCLSRVRSL
jgi:hypothetical protein